MTTCCHCREEIARCGFDGERCWAAGWRHVRFTRSMPVAAHFCAGDADGPLAEPAPESGQITTGAASR